MFTHRETWVNINLIYMITVNTVFDHRNRTRRGKPGAIEIRIIHNRRSQYVSTGIRVKASEFRDGRIINRPDSDILNERLSIIRTRIEAYVNDAIKSGAIDMSRIKAYITTGVLPSETKTEFLDWFGQKYKKLPVSADRKKHYKSTLLKLIEYDRIKTWGDISKASIIEFDTWLHNLTCHSSRYPDVAKRLDTSTIYNQHKNLKRMLRLAVDTGLLQENPYDRLKGKFSRGEKENIEYLDDDDIRRITDFRPSDTTRLRIARDIFVCQMYTGMSFADVLKADLADYQYKDGKYTKVGKRTKTGSLYVSQLLPPVVEVLEKYNGRLPHISNQEYNRLLKQMGEILNIKIKLHSHLARHTFATLMLRNGVPVASLQSMLGHRKITQTMKYAKILSDTVSGEYSRVEKVLFDKE